MNLSLEDKTSIICGSTQGIGLAIAKELALLGANCILLARNETSLKEAMMSLDSSAGQQHKYAVADFSKNDEVKKAVEKILPQPSGLTRAVQAAACYPPKMEPHLRSAP